MPDRVLIWSNEHSAWWAADERGYTTSRREAGQYDKERAVEICRQANLGVPDDQPPYEAIVPMHLT